MSGSTVDTLDAWEPRLAALADRVREAARGAMAAALAARDLARVDRPVAAGVGDVSFGLDVPTERVVTSWLEEHAREGPLSLLSEESGWRHLGPDPARPDGPPRALSGFDHGGPRIVIDPVDGTRNLMADLRSAWTAIALCPPGRAEPRLSDVELALCAELPDSRAALARHCVARRGAGARVELRALEDGALVAAQPLTADGDDRADDGYFSFFCYAPAMRSRVAAVAAEFFALLEHEEGADPRHCYDDQYISNCGQLVLLAAGTYRLIADVRAALWEERLGPRITSKPYDCAAGILLAREAGCVVRGARGEELDFPLDALTPVSFVGWANAQTAARLGAHLQQALQRAGGS